MRFTRSRVTATTTNSNILASTLSRASYVLKALFPRRPETRARLFAEFARLFPAAAAVEAEAGAADAEAAPAGARTKQDVRDFPVWLLVLRMVVRCELRGSQLVFRAAPAVRGKWRQALQRGFDRLVRGTQAVSFRMGRWQVDVCFGPGPKLIAQHRAFSTSDDDDDGERDLPPPFPARSGSAAHRRYTARLMAQEVWLLNALHARNAPLVSLLSQSA